jgi:hypothetical protein
MSMRPDIAISRRVFLRGAAGLASLALPPLRTHAAVLAPAPPTTLLRVSTDILDIAYYAAGPENGRPVVLAHDFGYGIEASRAQRRCSQALACACWRRNCAGTAARASTTTPRRAPASRPRSART